MYNLYKLQGSQYLLIEVMYAVHNLSISQFK
jgi:hypothetical protein